MKEKGKATAGYDKNKIIRQVFRLPIDERDNVSIKINSASYDIINIGTNGVGLLIDSDVPFSVDQPLPSIELHLDKDLLKLKGRVVHVSPREFQLICGIEFITPSKEDAEKIMQFLRRHRESLFGEI